MPYKPKTFRAAGQPTPEESRRQRDRQRGSFRRRGYTAGWDKLKDYLKQLPEFVLCDECEQQRELFDHVIPQPQPGIVTAAALLGFAWTDDMMLDVANIAPKCRRCHAAKTKRFDGGHGARPDTSPAGKAALEQMIAKAKARADAINARGFVL